MFDLLRKQQEHDRVMLLLGRQYALQELQLQLEQEIKKTSERIKRYERTSKG